MNKSIIKDEILKALIKKECEPHSETLADFFKLNHSTVYTLLKEMESAGHIETLETASYRSVTNTCVVRMVLPKGEDFFGTTSYRETEAKFAEEKELQLRKLKIDVENAERINSTYWWTFWFAVIGFALSLLLVILKLVERAD